MDCLPVSPAHEHDRMAPGRSSGQTIEARATVSSDTDEFDASRVHDALYRSTRDPLIEALHGAWRALRSPRRRAR
jgi:hypothetical protein